MTSKALLLEPGIELIAGLGNPGTQYDKTRHNAGFWFVERVARDYRIELRPEQKFQGEAGVLRFRQRDIRLLKPQTYMNHSGRAVAAMMNFYKISLQNILVVHDELDLPAGTIRLKFGGGHGGHNGLRDMVALGGKDFWRLRIGIGHPGDKSQVLDYVLKEPGKTERTAIEQALDAAQAALELMLEGQMEKAMHLLHSK